MVPDVPSGAPACAGVRERLPDLLADRLENIVRTHVRHHLLECQACAEALAALIADEALRRPGARAPATHVPPLDVYAAFLRVRQTRFGTLWNSVLDALGAADNPVREWGRAKREAIGQGLGVVLAARPPGPAVVRTAGATRVRGAVRTRGATRTRESLAARAPACVAAEVVTSDSAPAGGTVLFRLVESPHITDEGRFRLRLQTDALAYAGQVALCAIELDGGERVSFSGIVTRHPDADVCSVEMDEAEIARVPGQIPLERVSVFVTRP